MALEKFHYTTESGKSITLPKFKHIAAGVIRKVRKLTMADQIFTALESFGEDKVLAVLDELTQEQFNTFIEAWQEDSKVTPGELKASSDS